MKTDLFQSCGHCWVFQICWHIECSTFTASSFRLWNSSTGISSPPLALFIVMLSKAHLTSHSRMSGSRSVITPKSFLRLLSSDYLTFWFTHHVSFSNLGKVWKAWFKSIPMPAHPSVPMEEKRMCWGMRFRQHKIEVRLLPGYTTARSKSAQWRTKTGRWWDF